MKYLAAAIIAIVLCTSAASAQSSQLITVTHPGSQPSVAGSVDNFTGSVRVDSRFQGTAPARISGGIVTFEPGARTAWHTHPLGQTLIVTAGAGLVQEWDGPAQEIRPGDILWIPSGVKHWHGATVPTACRISASRKPSTARRSRGWSRHRKSSTGAS
jgi:quercetin dioxygenase-like cupin family protein